MKKFIYLLLIPLCMGFAACGDDEPEPPVKQEQQEQENADLIGWWKEPDNDLGYVPMGDDYTSARHALHFINANTVEEAWVVRTEQVSNNDVYGRNSWKNAFSGWYYFTAFYYYTWVYKREGNVIQLQRSSENNNNIVIVNNKLRWGSVEYEKMTNQ